MDPVPLLLSEISAFGYAHVNEKVEVNEIKRKHNVENYIRVSIGCPELEPDVFHFRWSDVTLFRNFMSNFYFDSVIFLPSKPKLVKV